MTLVQLQAAITAAGGIDKIKVWSMASAKYFESGRYTAGTLDTTNESIILTDKTNKDRSYVPVSDIEFVNY